MALTSLNSRWLLLALPLLGAMAGCCCEAFPLPGECTSCPTDARRIYCGAGEEAVRRCPCGPDREFYGHKPTDWRAWPDGWRYGQYGCNSQPIEQTAPSETLATPTKIETNVENPFRGHAVEELPAAVTPPIAKPAAQPAPEDNTPKAVIPPTTPPTTPPATSPPLPPQTIEPIERPAATPLDPNPLYLPPALKKPAKDTDENKTSFDGGEGPRLFAAQNGMPVVEKHTSDSAVQQAAKTETEPTAVPASAWGGRTKAKPAAAHDDKSPLSKRVAEHFTHNLLD